MKVYEVMEQYKDYKFLIYSSNDECLFNGYRAVCKSWCLNLYVEKFAELYDGVVIFVY